MATTTKGTMGGPVVVVNIFFNGEEAEGRQRFSKFFELGPVLDAVSMIPYEALNGLHNATIPYGINYHLNGTSRGPRGVTPEMSATLMNQLIATASAPGASAPEGVTPTMTLLWEFYNMKKLSSVAPDATAFRMRVPHPLITMLITWDGDSPEATADAKERLSGYKRFAEGALKDSFEGGEKGENDTGYGNNGEWKFLVRVSTEY